MTSVPIPNAAVDAAVVAIKRRMERDLHLRDLARAVLEAAAPYMMAQGWDEGANAALDALNKQINREPYKMVNPYNEAVK